MLKGYIETGIKSYESRIRYEKARAIRAINANDFMSAVSAATRAQSYQQAIEELETLREEAETWQA